MAKYERLYAWEVIGAVTDGKQVMSLNRSLNIVCSINKLSIQRVCEIVAEAKATEDTPYGYMPPWDFWAVHEEENEDDDAVSNE